MATTTKNTPAKGAAASAARTTQAAPDGTTRQVLQVIAKRDGFRRAGRAWSGTTTVPLDELTEEQFKQLTAEPMLVTLLLEVPADQVGELAAADGAAGGETGT